MVKLLAFVCLSTTMLFGFYPDTNENANKIANDANAPAVATCYGKTPCKCLQQLQRLQVL